MPGVANEASLLASLGEATRFATHRAPNRFNFRYRLTDIRNALGARVDVPRLKALIVVRPPSSSGDGARSAAA